MLIAVNPGMVLISFTSTRPPRSRKKSTRESPAPSMARKARSASVRIASAVSGGSEAGMMTRAACSTYLSA